MNNLVPEVRADVNGKLVTRHVKADASGAAPARALPLPALPQRVPAGQHQSNVNAVWDAVDSALGTGAFEGTFLSSPEELRNALDSLDESTVAAFRSAIDDQPDIGFEDLLVSILHNRCNSDTAWYLLLISQQAGAAHMDNYWDDGIEGTVEYDNCQRAYRGIQQFGTESGYALPESIYSADDKQRADVAALAKMIRHGHTYDVDGVILDWNRDALVLADVELGHLAVEYPDRIDDIIKLLNNSNNLDGKMVRDALRLAAEYPDSEDRIFEVMQQRNTSDMDAVRNVLDAEVQPLSNGAL